jgi:hypothetical protein
VAAHFITKCSCGAVISQCRCPDNNKPVTVIPDACERCHNPPIKITRVAGKSSVASIPVNVATWELSNQTGTLRLNWQGLLFLEDLLNAILHSED